MLVALSGGAAAAQTVTVAPHDAPIPFGRTGEPAASARARSGFCHDRSRTIEKALRLAGFKVRHSFLWGRSDGSHASTTRRGRRCARRGKLDADEGIRKVEQYAAWLEREWPSAAASLREGLAELFTVNRLGLPAALRRCLTTTNIIDSSHAGVRQHTRRVSRWRNGEMAVRAAATFCETEKNFRRVTGYQHLWTLDGAMPQRGRWRQR